MSKMTEAKKRDFVTQIITLVEENREVLNDKGFDPAERVDGLKTKKTACRHSGNRAAESSPRGERLSPCDEQSSPRGEGAFDEK